MTLTAGLGLKPEHDAQALACSEPGLWLEVHAENYMLDGGPQLAWLEAFAGRHPLSLHGVALSLGGHEPLDERHLQALAALVRRVQPALVSEHLAWSRVGGQHLPDLLPVQRSDAALHRLCAHVQQVQDTLGRTIAVENPSHYLHWPGHDWDEVEFLTELARRTGCGLLLDLNNVHVSACNLGFDAAAWVDRVPAGLVREIHLAGHSEDPALGAGLLVDSHDQPVAEPVWVLLERFLQRAGPRPVLIERDGNLPAWSALLAERSRAHAALLDTTRETSHA